MRIPATSSAVRSVAFVAGIGIPAVAVAQNPATPASRDTVTVVACVAQEADYVRADAPEAPASRGFHLLLAHVETGLPTYSLAGTRESELSQYVGQRLEISGRVESARTTPVLTTADGSRTGSVKTAGAGASGSTPDGAPAHEPSDALSATVPAANVPQPAARIADPAYLVATIPRLNALAFRRVAGACPAPAHRAATAAADASVAQRAAPARAPAPQASETRRLRPITARGCLARQTANGTALTPAADRADPLVLMKATIVTDAVRTSVPGGSSSSGGSGTLPDAAATAGAPVDAGMLSFALDPAAGELRELSRHVGERVEIVGMVRDATAGAGRASGTEEAASAASGANDTGRVQPSAVAPAHPSAADRAIAVTAFRAIGGTCN